MASPVVSPANSIKLTNSAYPQTTNSNTNELVNAARLLANTGKQLQTPTNDTVPEQNKEKSLKDCIFKIHEIGIKLKQPTADIQELKKEFEQTHEAFEKLIGADKLFTIQKKLLAKLSCPSESNTSSSTDLDSSQEDAADLTKRLIKRFAATQPGHAHKHVHGHEHPDGMVIDLDEAVHGVYAASKYIISALKGNPQHILDEFSRDAHDLANDTWTYLRDELIPHGIGEFAAGVGVSAIMLPLAYMAAKAGLEEMHHASHEIKDLKKHQGKLEEIQGNLGEMNKILESNYLETETKVVNSKATLIQRALKQSKRDWKIGLCSFGSGVSIGTKALSDIGLKISLGVQGLLTGKGFLGASQVISASTPTALVTTVLGAVSTFMLGPLAGLFATGLGAYFTRKSTSKRNQLKTDFKVAAEQLSIDPKTGEVQLTSEPKEESKPKEEKIDTFNIYQTFIGRQGKRRVHFFKDFTRWNKAFMIGSGLYAASATTKAIVAGLALGGLTAAASNPIGLGIITAVGTIGALGMGIASYCFITGHGKQGKYSNHTAGDDKLVDRDLLVRAQAHAVDKNKGRDIKEQIKLASACLERLNARKDTIRTFLNEAAKNSKTKKGVEKISPFLATKNGKKTDGAKKDKTQQLTLWKRLKGQALNVKDVEAYVKKNFGKILDFAKTDLKAEEKYLKEQLSTLKTLAGWASETKPNAQGFISSKGAKALTKEFINYTDEELINKQQATQARLDQTKGLIDRIFKSTEEKSTEERSIENYPNAEELLQHWGVRAEKGKENHALADYLLDDVDKDLRNARGVLFEAQLQASQLVG